MSTAEMVYSTTLALPGTFLNKPEPPGDVFQRWLGRAFDWWEPPRWICTTSGASLQRPIPRAPEAGEVLRPADWRPLTASSRSSCLFQFWPRFLPGEAILPSSGRFLKQRPAGLEGVPRSFSLQPLSRPSLGGGVAPLALYSLQ